jgi:hypothetical protein
MVSLADVHILRSHRHHEEGSSKAAVMESFLIAYGVQPAAITKLRTDCPELFCLAGGSSCVYEVGRVLCLLHSLGYSHSAVLSRIVPLYPQVCAVSLGGRHEGRQGLDSAGQ